MARYQTRHLEALVDLEVGRDVIPKGTKFFATEDDANYFNRKRPRVRDVPEQEQKSAMRLSEPIADTGPPPADEWKAPAKRTYIRRAPSTVGPASPDMPGAVLTKSDPAE
jgi:hypothetical protein